MFFDLLHRLEGDEVPGLVKAQPRLRSRQRWVGLSRVKRELLSLIIQ